MNDERSFSSVQTFHTHTPCRSRVGEMEMKMTWQWTWGDTLHKRDTRRGTQKKKEERRKHQHHTPSPKRANPGRAREKKRRKDDGPKTDQRRGGQKRLTQPTRREPNLPRHAKDSNLTQHERTHEIGGPWRTIVREIDATTKLMQSVVIRLKALGGRFNPWTA